MGVNSIMNDAGRIGFVVKGTYDNTATYDFLDVVYYNNATYVAKKLTVGNEPQSSSEFWQVLMDGGVNFNDIAPTFTQAETRENINSGEKLPVLFGKIKKWYTDLKAVAFSGSYNDLSDTPSIPAAVAVKGNAESSYRTGNVNLTPANIGAVPTANVLDSKESITANTASGNVAGALGTKEINANLQSQIDTLNSNLSNRTKTFVIYELGTIDCFVADNDTYLCVAYAAAPSPTMQTFAIISGNKYGTTISVLLESTNVKIKLSNQTVQLESIYGNGCYMLAFKLR